MTNPGATDNNMAGWEASHGTTARVIALDAATLSPEDLLFQHLERELDRLFPRRLIQRVLLVLPPDGCSAMFRFEGARNQRYHNNPPYGLGLLAAHLRKEGLCVRLLNLNNTLLSAALQCPDESSFDYERVVHDSLKQELTAFKPDIVGLSAMFSLAHSSTVECCRQIRRLAPCTPIALGGVHFTNAFHSTVTRHILLAELEAADLLFVFEAELSFRDFLRVINRKTTANALTQVVFIRTDPILYCSGRKVPQGADLDVMPAYDLMQLDQLSAHGNVGALQFLLPPKTKVATCLSTRGCRGHCSFCSVRRFNGVGVRQRSVQSVVDELLVLRHEHGIQHVVWLDDDFLFDQRRCLQLFSEMVRQKVGLTWDWTNGIIAASCTDEIMSAAAAAGCIGLFLGMESGNPRILRAVKKPGTVQHFLRAAEIVRKYDQINARVYLMFGFPGETFGMIRDTLEVAREMNLDWSQIHPLQPLPNTPIYDDALEHPAFSDVTFARSDYSAKTREALKMGDVLLVDFEHVFEDNDPQTIPTRDQHDAIWAHLFFHLNYTRLFKETRRLKLQQAFQYIHRMATMVIPRSGFAWYFRNYLAYRLHGSVDTESSARLAALMASHGLYERRFKQLGMPLGWIEHAMHSEPTAGVETWHQLSP